VTQGAAAAGRIGAPIAAQMISLMAAGWIITLAVTVFIVLLLPQPQQSSYPLAEIVEALNGGDLVSHGGRPLIRVQQAAPPPAGQRHLTNGIYRMALAAALHRPLEQVRLERYRVSDPFRRVLLRTLQANPPRPVSPAGTFLPPVYGPPVVEPPPPVEPAHPETGARPGSSVAKAPAAPARPRAAGAPQPVALDSLPPMVDDFDVGVQDPSGAWTVVKPAPPTFPDAWQQRIILWFVTCFALLTPIGYLFARRLAAPIGQFAQAAERLGRDPKAQAVEISGPAELGRAAAAFNEMQARLARYVEHQTTMVAAIAHDLRTPLARVRFKIDALAPQAREAIGRDLSQMEQMISAVLAFVRDASEECPREPLDLASAVQCVVDNAALLGAEVKVVSAAPLVVHADALGLDGLFTNLVDNAIKYGRRARVRIYRDGDSAVVDVSDSGPGLPEVELERVFEPFYRAEPSRNPQTGGMGLGLSAARGIARAHGGDIVLINGRDGLIARVRLPLPGSVASAA
jgi:signal transduction histidine kinase